MYKYPHQAKELNKNGRELHDPNHTEKPSSNQYRKNHVLDYIIRANDITLLKHPLVLSLVNEKWNAYGKLFYYLDFLIYFCFMILLNLFCVVLTPPKYFFKNNPDDIEYYNYRKINCTEMSSPADYRAEYIESSGHMKFNRFLMGKICEDDGGQNFLIFRCIVEQNRGTTGTTKGTNR